jgi:hypothetical protein
MAILQLEFSPSGLTPFDADDAIQLIQAGRGHKKAPVASLRRGLMQCAILSNAGLLIIGKRSSRVESGPNGFFRLICESRRLSDPNPVITEDFKAIVQGGCHGNLFR